MKTTSRTAIAALTVALGIGVFMDAANADQSLRDQAQNPGADLISAQAQNNTNFGVGRLNNTQNITNIQPVIPINLTPETNLILRPILPVTYQPAMFRGDSTDFGLGSLDVEFFFANAKPIPFMGGGLTVGPGGNFLAKTETDPRLGAGKWGAGPSFVVVATRPLGMPVVAGALVSQTWSFAGDSDRENVSSFEVQPFINYNLPEGWYLNSAPAITANWEAESDKQWTLPVGGGIGRLFKIGEQNFNGLITAYSNVITPDDGGANWQLRTQLTLLFPE